MLHQGGNQPKEYRKYKASKMKVSAQVSNEKTKQNKNQKTKQNPEQTKAYTGYHQTQLKKKLTMG